MHVGHELDFHSKHRLETGIFPEVLINSQVFDILDSYDYTRFNEVLSTDLKYEGGLQKTSGLDNFINVSKSAPLYAL